LSVVVDSSVVVAALIDTGADGAWAEKILERDALYAPEHLPVEVANVIRRLERGKQITEQEANGAFGDLMELDVALYGFEAFSERVWELRRNVAIYDGWYVALAEALDLPLATLDARLAKAEGPKCRFFTPGSNK
jgi:predicted nucleic acid-binding protein